MKSTLALLSIVALAQAQLDSVPKLNPQRHMVISWKAQVKSLKTTFSFEEHHYYDTSGQMSRIDSVNATDGNTMLVTSINKPLKDGLSFQYDYKKQQCTEWDFKGKITGFAQFTPDMTRTADTIDGVACWKYSKTLTPKAGPAWTYTVWLSQAAPQRPVAVYSSNWEQKDGDTMDDGVRHVTQYAETLPPKIFDPAFEGNCTKPGPVPMGTCDMGSKSCKPCAQGAAGCTTMAVCELQLQNKCTNPPGKNGFSCDWLSHTCKPDPTDPGQSKESCEALCHPY